jgi:multidrug resistance efflux pump
MSEGEIDQKQIFTNQTPIPKKGRLSNVLRLVTKNPLILVLLAVVVIISGYFGFQYWQDVSSKVFIENSEITGPVTSLGPDSSGILREVYVKEGDHVSVGQPLFNVSGRITSSMTPGIITLVQNTPGQMESPQSVVVKLYDPSGLRVKGHLQEDQGLSDMRIGQKVIFTLDAYGSKQYQGTVDTISPISDDSSVVFSISDKRQEKQFDVNVKFDINAYPEIKNGMSAKMWVIK